ncbi:hypothetical protein SAMN05878426_104189 [Phaeovulum vinaykumarii]|uniref:Uncharacterized protein n=1 Tax=Phaeovulum vinaykumarii TaxID=407234 RepID=A0A1N7LSL4_9RHOB|nr:hypothetical protein SAMN05421795_10465 [Phaeovulum vinaykumarii]SOC07702.1 hypothetical protein SAMN05878426_104189 [Phaeovulum vinaykumarii]
MPFRSLPLLWRGRSRPRARHRHPRISCCGPCRTGNLRRSHSRGADGRRVPGSGCCLGRRCYLRRPPMARHGGHRHCGLSVPAVLRRGQAPGRGRPAPPLAACRPYHRRMRAALRVPRERRQSSPSRIPRGRQRTGRHGLPPCGRPLHGGGSRRAAQARAALHPRPPRRRRAGRPRAPALAPGRVAATGRSCCGSGRRLGPAPTRTGRRSRRHRRKQASTG